MEVPPLLCLALDNIVVHGRRLREEAAAASSKRSGGTFWRTAEEEAPVLLSLLPLPAELKASTLCRLRSAGKLEDESLLLLLDHGFVSLSLASCRMVGGASLCLLASLCSSLTALDLSWCCQLRGEGDLSELGALPALASLALRGCFRLAAPAAWELAARSPALTSLDLSSCDRICSLPAPGPASGPPTLARVETLLLRASSLTDDALRGLPALCPRLATLDLTGTGVTDEAVSALLTRSASLAHLDLRRCPRLQGHFASRDSPCAAPSATLRTLLLSGARVGGSRRPQRDSGGASWLGSTLGLATAALDRASAAAPRGMGR